MEPTDELDAPNRRLPESRVRRFAKRRSAFRPSSFFLANPRVSITSSIERLGCCWLWKPRLGRWQGTISGAVSTAVDRAVVISRERPQDSQRVRSVRHRQRWRSAGCRSAAGGPSESRDAHDEEQIVSLRRRGRLRSTAGVIERKPSNCLGDFNAVRCPRG